MGAMMTKHYYNEIDEYAASWLEELIFRGELHDGDVDRRSIEDVAPSDLAGYRQCHFFAGIGGWPLALRNSGWPSDREVWTGSCPCQPFSTAGKGGGFDDERHLWPSFHWLITQCRPPVVLGEQVASKATDVWIDLVHADLEALGYAFGCVPFPAAGVGAPHIRDRNYWVGHANDKRLERWLQLPSERPDEQLARPDGVAGWMADADSRERDGVAILRGDVRDRQNARWPQGSRSTSARGGIDGVADAACSGWAEERPHGGRSLAGDRPQGDATGPVDGNGDQLPRQTNGFWSGSDWLACRDGKWRPAEPGTQPLVDGVPGRVGRLRAYGNAIVVPQAEEFIKSVMSL